jgi:hypothetical protein
VSTAGGADRPAFDPRHDARYQRGYQPGDATTPAPLPAPPRTPRSAAPATPAPAVPPAAADAEDPDGFDALVFDADAFQDEPELSRRNPFIALLWLVVVVFIGGAVTLQLQSATLAYSNTFYDGNGPVPFSMLLQQVSYSVASPMLISGLITLAGLLFWHAWVWRARTRADANAAG